MGKSGHDKPSASSGRRSPHRASAFCRRGRKTSRRSEAVGYVQGWHLRSSAKQRHDALHLHRETCDNAICILRHEFHRHCTSLALHGRRGSRKTSFCNVQAAHTECMLESLLCVRRCSGSSWPRLPDCNMSVVGENCFVSAFVVCWNGRIQEYDRFCLMLHGPPGVRYQGSSPAIEPPSLLSRRLQAWDIS